MTCPQQHDACTDAGPCASCPTRATQPRQGGAGGTKRFHPVDCPVAGCDKPTAKGSAMCAKHLARVRRHGNVEGRTPLVRFMEKVYEDPLTDCCWVWTGATDSRGYGQVHTAGTTLGIRNAGAHRVAYELLVGPIPDGLHLDHLCHTRDVSCTAGTACPHRRCVNPQHLEPVQPEENTLRGRTPTMQAHRTNTCKRGHDLTQARVTTRRDGSTFRQCRECARITAAERKT